MTPAGLSLAGEIEDLAAQVRERVLKGVNAAEKSVALDVMRVMADNMAILAKE